MAKPLYFRQTDSWKAIFGLFVLFKGPMATLERVDDGRLIKSVKQEDTETESPF